jgi:NADPH:quinone reductase-like Zn-dependent oxidoreductase
MRAIVVDPTRQTLEPTELADPTPGAGEVLIRVHAAGVNRADLLARTGSYPTIPGSSAPEPVVAGLELAGEIVALGADVNGVDVGDRVMAMGRGYAELACVDHRVLLPVPAAFTWAEAAATPVGLLTGHNALVTSARLTRGESVLIQAVTSGAGTLALAIAVHLGARPVFGTSRSGEKLARLPDELLGIDTTSQDVVETVMESTGDRGVDVILDNVGASVLEENVASAAIGGRIVQIGRLGGGRTEVDLEELALKRLSLIGVTFRTRTPDDRAEVVRLCLGDLSAGLQAGQLRPVVEDTFSLASAELAQTALAENTHVGKFVLTVD